MSVRLEDDRIRLVGDCPVEDAEPLHAHLLADAARRVDLSQARRLHTAVVQVLAALRPELDGDSLDPFTSHWLRRCLRPTLPNRAVSCDEPV